MQPTVRHAIRSWRKRWSCVVRSSMSLPSGAPCRTVARCRRTTSSKARLVRSGCRSSSHPTGIRWRSTASCSGPNATVPVRAAPTCPGCTHFHDGFDGSARHILQRANFVVVAKSPLPRLLAFARERGWRYLRLLSTAGNNYDRDYFGDSTALSRAMRDQQEFKPNEEWDMPMLNVFRREGGTVRHFWGSELLYVPPEEGQEYRHNDLLDSVWNFFDVTPQGRGDFQPKLEYR